MKIASWGMHNIRHLLFSLRFSILFILFTLLVMTSFCIIFITSIAFSDEISYTSHKLMKHVSNLVIQELKWGIRPIEVAGNFSANLIKSGVINPNEEELVPYTYHLVSTASLLQGAYWGDENGNFIYSEKEADGSISTEIFKRSKQVNSHVILHRDVKGNIIKREITSDMSFDPRVRPWYMGAKKNHKATWTDIYHYYPTLKSGISVGVPVFANDKFVGVFGLDMRLDYLSRFVTDLHVSRHGFAFIITTNEDLVAYPQKKLFTDYLSHKNKVVNVHTLGIPIIDKSIDTYKQSSKREFNIDVNHETYLVTYQPVMDLATHGLLVGVITPLSDFVSFLQRVYMISLIVSLIALVIGLLIVSHLITRVVTPINKLVHETDKIKRFELDGDITIPSRIKEVIHLRNAIYSMKIGLKQFQRYVPRMLVRQLIESGQETQVGGVRKKLVVFFSDIENFTTIAEQMDANDLLLQVCDYFEAMTQIIWDEKGTIDKYIGDSIMAFWGAPLDVELPCDKAARAALRCQQCAEQLNAEWKKQGKPVFNTRIGIHVGEAIVGNVGSSERLNYTALGDTINLASRLEGINKNYQTKIIVSEDFYHEIKNRFALRKVDCVTVKGKTKAINIYELVGDDVNQVAVSTSHPQLELIP